MPKWFKTLLAFLLLPACLGAIKALARVLGLTGGAQAFWLAFLGGGACWWVVYLLLPRPMWVYVFGHELTHALWAWAFGGSVRAFKVSSKGGHVVVSKTNFLIALAPYFFPIYVVLVVIAFGLGHWLWDWGARTVWFHWLVGVAYGFHVTLTWHVLQRRQSDITSHGWLFSAVIIFLGNASILLLGLPLLTSRVSPWTSLAWWWDETQLIVARGLALL